MANVHNMPVARASAEGEGDDERAPQLPRRAVRSQASVWRCVFLVVLSHVQASAAQQTSSRLTMELGVIDSTISGTAARFMGGTAVGSKVVFSPEAAIGVGVFDVNTNSFTLIEPPPTFMI